MGMDNKTTKVDCCQIYKWYLSESIKFWVHAGSWIRVALRQTEESHKNGERSQTPEFTCAVRLTTVQPISLTHASATQCEDGVGKRVAVECLQFKARPTKKENLKCTTVQEHGAGVSNKKFSQVAAGHLYSLEGNGWQSCKLSPLYLTKSNPATEDASSAGGGF